MSETIETTWDQLPEALRNHVQRLQETQRRRRVRLVISGTPQEGETLTVQEVDPSVPPAAKGEEWARRLRAYAASHPPLPHPVDDSRDTIYAEVVRDSR